MNNLGGVLDNCAAPDRSRKALWPSRQQCRQDGFDQAPLGGSFSDQLSLGIDLQGESCTCMPHEFLNHLHVLAIGNKQRSVCMPEGMPSDFFEIPALAAAGRITFSNNTPAQSGLMPPFALLAKIQSSGLLYLLISVQIQRSAATRGSSGTGLRDVSVLQFPIVPRYTDLWTETIVCPKSMSHHFRAKSSLLRSPLITTSITINRADRPS